MANLLIIDDSPQMGYMLQELTQLLGHTSCFIEGGANGLAEAQAIDPDVVLLDVMMPEMNGWQVYNHLRDFSDVPVIFITTDDTAENRARAQKLGAMMVGKNIPPKRLNEKIKALLNR